MLSATGWQQLEPRQREALQLMSELCSSLSGPMCLLLSEQLQEAASQFAELHAITSKHTFIPSLDPLKVPDAKDVEHPSLLYDDHDGSWGLQEREEKALLSPETSKLLASVFAFADALDKAQLTGLAHSAGCSEKQVRAFFSKLRTSTRTAIQKAQKRAEKSLEGTGGLGACSHARGPTLGASHQGWQQHHSAKQSGPFDLGGRSTMQAAASSSIQLPDERGGAAPAVVGAPSLSRAALLQVHQEQQLEHLRNLLDGSGAISSVSNAGHFLLSMQRTSSYQARAQHLSALAATANTAVLLRLAGSKLLDTFTAWLTEATEDGQLTFLTQALETLRQLPISTPHIQASSITSTVNGLVRHNSPSVIIAAYQLAKHWSSLTSLSTLDTLGPLIYGVQEPVQRSSSGGSGGSHGAAPKAAGGLARTSGKGVVSVGSGGVSQRKYSAAVKRKVHELQLVPGFGGGVSTGGASRCATDLIVEGPACCAKRPCCVSSFTLFALRYVRPRCISRLGCPCDFFGVFTAQARDEFWGISWFVGSCVDHNLLGTVSICRAIGMS
jgi:hypothetical protein